MWLAGLQLSDEYLRDEGLEHVGIDRAVTTVEQRTPSTSNAAMRVVVLQWPCGVFSSSR